MATTERLTRTGLEAAQQQMLAEGRSREIRWDSEVVGLGALLLPKTISLILNYTDEAGAKRRVTIGKLSELTLEKARKAAAEMKLNTRLGRDPLKARRQAKEAQKARVVFSTVAAEWLVAHEGRWRPKTGSEYARILEKFIEPKLGKLAVAEFTTERLSSLFTEIGQSSPATAALAFRALGSCLRWAEDTGKAPFVRLPKASRVAPVVAPRERVVTDEELVKVWAATDELRPRSRAMARWLILSALRRGAGEQLLHSWIVKDGVEVPAEAMKAGKAHFVPLTDWARLQIACATEMKRAGPFVFSDTKAAPDRAKATLERLIEVSGVKGWSWHDLRRSFRTWAARSGVPRDHAEEALAHRSHRSALDRAYDLHDYREQAAAALKGWQKHVERLVTKADGGNVVDLATAKGRR